MAGIFREPVYGMYDSEIYICDWHNNRIAIFDEEFNYISEIGSSGYSARTTNVLTLMLRVINYTIKQSFKGSYFDSHFQNKIDSSVKVRRLNSYSFKLGINNILYLYRKFGLNFILNKLAGDSNTLHKPNGIAKYKGFLFITEKNKRCVTFFYKNILQFTVKKRFNRIRNYKFGRLGNIKLIDNYLAICDEMKGRIFFYNLLSKDFFIIEDKSDSDFQPFSICKINKSLLVTGGKNHFYLIDLHSKKLICKKKVSGEIHSLESKFDSRSFFLLDRLNSKINEYTINYNE